LITTKRGINMKLEYMKFTRSLIIGMLLTVACLPQNAAAGESLPFFHDARSMALGNADLLVQPSLSMGWTNPALSAGSGLRIYIPAYQFRINTRTLKTFKFIQDNTERFADVETLSPEDQQAFYNDMEPFDDQYVDINNDVACGFYLGGFGLLLQGQSGLGVKLDRGIYTPAVGLKGNILVGLTFSYSMRFRDIETIGISMTPLWGKTMMPTRFSAGDLNDNAAAQEKFWGAMGDSTMASGLSTTVGYTRELPSGIQGGASISDLFASFDGRSYNPQLSAGVSGTLDRVLPEKYITPMMDRVTWMAGWNDILNLNGTNLFSRMHFGTEISLPLLQLRGGINQGYPTVGFGLRFKVISLDYALYGMETGRKPGLGEDYSHVVQLSLGWI